MSHPLLTLLTHFLMIAQAGGLTWDLFGFSFIFSHKGSLDHSATAPPTLLTLCVFMLV